MTQTTADGLPIVAVVNGSAPAIQTPAPAVEEKRVIINFTRRNRAPVEVNFDPDLLTWEDQVRVMKLQERVEKGEISAGEMLEAATDLLCKVTGQDVRKLPGYVVQELMAQLNGFNGEQDETQKNSG